MANSENVEQNEEYLQLYASVKGLFPLSSCDFLHHVSASILGTDLYSQLTCAVNCLYSDNFSECLEICDILLDRVWEELNTGHWKNVDINWRHVYTLLSVMKSLSQLSLMMTNNGHIEYSSLLKTCDLGLLMGAPLMNNILSRLCKIFQGKFSGISSCFKWNNSNNTKGCSDQSSQNKKSRRDNNFCPVDNVSNFSHTEHTVSDNCAQGCEDLSPLNGGKVSNCFCPSVETFNANYFALETPVVISGAISHWPAFSDHDWTLDYLRSVAGGRTVPVEIGSRYTEEDWTQKLMTIDEFIENFIINSHPTSKGYLAQHNLFDQVSC